MGKRQWGMLAGWLVAIAALVGAGVLVYQHWQSLLTLVLSPVGGFVVKALFGAKAVKFVLAAGFAATAGVVAVRRKLRRGGEPEAEPQFAPPVYGPPEPEVGPAQVGTAQVGTAQVGTAQVGTAQVGAPNVGPGVWSSERAA
jgi:hypothetical protein